MKNTLNLFIFLFLSTLSFGQKNHLSFETGVSISKMTTNEEDYLTKHLRKGIFCEVTYAYALRNKGVIEFGGQYIQKGFASPIKFTDENGQAIDERSIIYSFDYIGLPVRIGYTIGNRFSLTGKIGLMPSILLSAKTKAFDIPVDPLSSIAVPSRDLKDEMKNMDFSALTALEMALQIRPAIAMTLGTSFQYGLLDNGLLEGIKYSNISFVGSLGVQYFIPY